MACKWIFKVKNIPDGSVDHHKTRLVAKGFTQRPRLDYHAIFSPVIKPTIVRLVLSIVVQNHWPLHQLDVNNAFLQGHLLKDVYMSQPPGFEHPDLPHYVCKFRKAIYCLRQGPRTWYTELHIFLLSIGFSMSRSDESPFILHTYQFTVYILVYVDDIIVTGPQSAIIRQVISCLSARFSLKDLGRLDYFLGVQVLHRPNGIILSQKHYLNGLL